MKKLTIFITVILCLMFMMVGCGKKEGANVEQVAVADSAELLNKVWDEFGEDERFYAMGGDFSNPVDNAAGIFNIEDTENLAYMLYVPTQSASMIDEAASLIHAMNSNTFTGAAFHLTNVDDTDAFVAAMKTNILNTQWMCGIPDELAIYVVNGEYVVSAFGNAEIMENFKTKLVQIYGEGAVLEAEEKIM